MAKSEISTSEVEAKLDLFETRIGQLRISYEQYFAGIDRRPPTQQRQIVVRVMQELEHKTYIVNTAHKFRLRSLIQRFHSYRNYWDRTQRQIEEGTYRRDRIRAAARDSEIQMANDESEEAIALALEEDVALDEVQRELEELVRQGAFDHLQDEDEDDDEPLAHTVDERAFRPAPRGDLKPRPVGEQPSSTYTPATNEKLQEIQRKLGISGTAGERTTPPRPIAAPSTSKSDHAEEDSGDDTRSRKIKQMRQRLKDRVISPASTSRPAAVPTPIRGASVEQLRKLHQAQAEVQKRSARPKPHVPDADDAQMQRLYRNFVEAKKRCNEPTDEVSYDNLAKSVRQQREQIQQQYGAKDVDFKVVIKDGKAFIKPETK